MQTTRYLSKTLGFKTEYNSREPNLADAFKNPNQYSLHELIVEHDEFDVLPSSIDMFRLQQDLIAFGRQPRKRLSTFLDGLDQLPYDQVIVDAPSSLGVINDNVVLACRNVVVPVEVMESSREALKS